VKLDSLLQEKNTVKIMTKLMQWLTLLLAIAVMWMAAYTNTLIPQFRTEILWTPVMMVVLFGLYSVFTIAYRVATFNDCEDASKELQRQIGEAREDLRSKGFNFEDVSDKKKD